MTATARSSTAAKVPISATRKMIRRSATRSRATRACGATSRPLERSKWARQSIVSSHYLSEEIFAALFEISPFVPRGLVMTYSHGFNRFFHGDFISGLDILAPLLEASLRHVLKVHGHDVTKLDDATKIQEDRTISSLFEQMRPELDSIFGSATTTDMENVFVYEVSRSTTSWGDGRAKPLRLRARSTSGSLKRALFSCFWTRADAAAFLCKHGGRRFLADSRMRHSFDNMKSWPH